MPNSRSLWCCAYLRREIEAVLATESGLSGLNVEIYAPTCFLNPRGAQKTLVALAAQQCFYLVAPGDLVDSFIADGAYLMTPGWLADWRRRLGAWGFDQDTTRQFFQETTTKLVLLDIGVYGDCRAELDAMAAYLDLPFQVLPIGLDMLRLQLACLARSPALEAQPEQPSQRQLTDHLMLLELLSDLLTADDDGEALERVSAMFHLLFAPGSLRFLPAGSQGEATALGQANEYAWTASGRGFMPRLSNRGERIGALEVDELALADYKERYLSLALPLAKVCALAIKAYLPVSTQAGAVERRAGGETVLVVEDEEHLRLVLCAALERLGYLPLCASSAEEAITLAGLRQEPIHLLLTDVVMPGLNDRELFEALAPTWPDLKVLYMSGYTENIIAHRGVLEAGINFIQKPFSMQQLTARINAVLFGASAPPPA